MERKKEGKSRSIRRTRRSDAGRKVDVSYWKKALGSESPWKNPETMLSVRSYMGNSVQETSVGTIGSARFIKFCSGRTNRCNLYIVTKPDSDEPQKVAYTRQQIQVVSADEPEPDARKLNIRPENDSFQVRSLEDRRKNKNRIEYFSARVVLNRSCVQSVAAGDFAS